MDAGAMTASAAVDTARSRKVRRDVANDGDAASAAGREVGVTGADSIQSGIRVSRSSCGVADYKVLRFIRSQHLMEKALKLVPVRAPLGGDQFVRLPLWRAHRLLAMVGALTGAHHACI
jgi:hypothetical protein